jgi:hypothetical protein
MFLKNHFRWNKIFCLLKNVLLWSKSFRKKDWSKNLEKGAKWYNSKFDLQVVASNFFDHFKPISMNLTLA